MPRRKKDPSIRARRNKASTSATLTIATEPTLNTEAYSALTVAQLRTEISRRNGDGRPDTRHLSKRGKKVDLVERLVADDNPAPEIPDLPARTVSDWHSETVAWWEAVWSSPMAKEWDASDLHNVLVVALLYDDIWTAETAKQRKDALAEYRLQRADLGLSPYARRRLEWTIETAEDAKARGQRRRGNGSTPAPQPATPAGPDPRLHLLS